MRSAGLPISRQIGLAGALAVWDRALSPTSRKRREKWGAPHPLRPLPIGFILENQVVAASDFQTLHFGLQRGAFQAEAMGGAVGAGESNRQFHAGRE